MKILIIKPSGIGDIVHSLPVAIGIKYLYPDSQLHWLVFDKFAEVLSNVKYVDKVILWNRSGGIKEYFKLLKRLKSENFDIIIDLQVLFRTAFLGFLIKNKKVISTSYVRELTHLFVKPVAKFNPDLHAVERNYQVVKFLAEKLKKSVPEPYEMLPWIKVENNTNLLKSFSELKPVVFSVSSRGEHKIWPAENFVSLIKLLKNKYSDFIPVFVGSKDEIGKVELVTKQLDILEIEYVNLTGKTTLTQLESVIQNSVLTISNDNGVAHISAAMNKPTLVLFGPTLPKWFYPYNSCSGYVYKPLKCSPCGIKTSCKNNVCMKQITPEEVFEYICLKFGDYLK